MLAVLKIDDTVLLKVGKRECRLDSRRENQSGAGRRERFVEQKDAMKDQIMVGQLR